MANGHAAVFPDSVIVHCLALAEWQRYQYLLLGINKENAQEVRKKLVAMRVIAGPSL